MFKVIWIPGNCDDWYFVKAAKSVPPIEYGSRGYALHSQRRTNLLSGAKPVLSVGVAFKESNQALESR